MSLKLKLNCKRCGGDGEQEVSPETFEPDPTTFILTQTCNAGCPPTYRTLTAQQATDMTRHSYDGVTGSGRSGLLRQLPSLDRVTTTSGGEGFRRIAVNSSLVGSGWRSRVQSRECWKLVDRLDQARRFHPSRTGIIGSATITAGCRS
jgi:hypothetical protein